mmetsp:Transcript_17261/g.26952  ORF Transcript_17261/g.26952 Transcript_17261/m.26952 type:complete len:506 (+) Transcript_17261:377-1894(+)
MPDREVLHEGFLCKRSVSSCLGRHTWKRHYFVLDDRRTLAYYDLTGELKGQLMLTQDTNVVPNTLRQNCLEVQTPYVKIILQADSERKRDTWSENLNIVIKDAQINRERSKLQDVRRKAREMRVPQNLGETGRGTHTFKAGGSTFEVDVRYSLVNVIGQGAYGVVVAANDAETGKQVAIKKIRGVFDNIIDGKRILREIKLLRFLNHKNISYIKDVMRSTSEKKFDDVYIVLDKMDTDLNRVIYSDQQLSDQHIQFLMFQLLSAVHYCATASVIHRDLKPSNILVNAACELRVCDFGLARGTQARSDELTTYVVTRWYRAPELILACDDYSSAIDMWSVGCIFAELLARKPLFPGEDYIHQLQLITDVLGTPSEADMHFIKSEKAKRFMRNQPLRCKRKMSDLYPKASAECLDLLNRMLHFNPDKRITVQDALEHPYLATLHQPDDEPLCEHIFLFDDNKADDELRKRDIQDQILEEVLHFHPEDRERILYEASQSKNKSTVFDV